MKLMRCGLYFVRFLIKMEKLTYTHIYGEIMNYIHMIVALQVTLRT